MLSTDREGFDALMHRLCAGFRTPPTQHRRDAYWRGFSKQSITEFERLVDIALESWEGTEAPTVSEMRRLKYSQRTQAPEASTPKRDERDTLLWFANRLCLALIGNRGGVGLHSLDAIRRAVLELVAWFMPPVFEGDETATPAAFIEMLTKALDAHLDVATRNTWSELAASPGANEPFPVWMARDYRPAPPQLELTA